METTKRFEPKFPRGETELAGRRGRAGTETRTAPQGLSCGEAWLKSVDKSLVITENLSQLRSNLNNKPKSGECKMEKTKEGVSDSLELFKELLARKGLKYTYEREFIYSEIQKIDRHFNADQLYERFKNRGERIARATVYRNLPLLLEAGVIQKSTGAGKRDFYEKTGAKGHHDHMVCIVCSRVIEFHSDELESLQERLASEYKFKIAFHDHRLFGYCEKCAV